MADNKAQLIIEGSDAIELPVLTGTMGPDVIDVRGLTSTGRFTFDPGFMSTASCESKITYIDGDKGILLHRGYPIEQLAAKTDYLETCYLLLHGELPTPEEKTKFLSTVQNHTMVHEQLKSFLNGFRRDAHPMAIMCGVVGALSAFYHDSLDINDPKHREISAVRLVAKMPTIAAMVYKYSMGQPLMYPRNDLSYSENFLHMMFNTPCEIKPISPVLAKAMDRIFISEMPSSVPNEPSRRAARNEAVELIPTVCGTAEIKGGLTASTKTRRHADLDAQRWRGF